MVEKRGNIYNQQWADVWLVTFFQYGNSAHFEIIFGLFHRGPLETQGGNECSTSHGGEIECMCDHDNDCRNEDYMISRAVYKTIITKYFVILYANAW